MNAVGSVRHSNGRRSKFPGWIFALLAVVLASTAVLQPSLRAQAAPTITGVDPGEGKVNDSLSISGQNLGKASVSAVFLSDDKSDYKAAIVSQSEDKIVFKVPQVKPGSYNVSIQSGAAILIQPVRFTVQQ